MEIDVNDLMFKKQKGFVYAIRWTNAVVIYTIRRRYARGIWSST